MNYFIKKYIVPLSNKYSHIPLVNSLKSRRRDKIIQLESKEIEELLADSVKVLISLQKKPLIGIIDYGEEVIRYPVTDNTLRYERFCKNNNIPYRRIDATKSTWMEDVEKCDLIVWAVSSKPSHLIETRKKIYIIEKLLKKACYPSFNEVYSYEDKVMQNYIFKIHGLPSVETFISNNRKETQKYINECSYPIVAKIATGSGSRGVDIIKTKREAQKFVKRVFSSGRKTYHSYQKQKDYVYFQKYIPDAEHDLRIIVVGDKALGYYRMTPTKDFRASGAGLVVKKALPLEGIRIAFKCKQAMNAKMIAVDMIKSGSNGEYQIIEASIFCGIETAEQLHVDGKPGYYQFDGENATFKEGKYWVQELLMYEVVSSWEKSNKQE